MKTMLNGMTFGLSSWILGPNDWNKYRELATPYLKDRIDWQKNEISQGKFNYLGLAIDEIGLGALRIGNESNVGLYAGFNNGLLKSVWSGRNAAKGAEEVVGSLDEINATIKEMKSAGKIVQGAPNTKVSLATYKEAEKMIVYKEGLNEAKLSNTLVHEASHAMGANEYQAYKSQLQNFKNLPFLQKLQDPDTLIQYGFDKIGIHQPIYEAVYKWGIKQDYWLKPVLWR
jgi:hypothetical protein